MTTHPEMVPLAKLAPDDTFVYDGRTFIVGVKHYGRDGRHMLAFALNGVYDIFPLILHVPRSSVRFAARPEREQTS